LPTRTLRNAAFDPDPPEDWLVTNGMGGYSSGTVQSVIFLRTLDPDHPDFKPKDYRDLRARDAAYHQGTVWDWLIGPFVDAWKKIYPRASAQRFLEGFKTELDSACIGTISEIFDPEPPYTPRSCVSRAGSVAEVLRAWPGKDLVGSDEVS